MLGKFPYIIVGALRYKATSSQLSFAHFIVLPFSYLIEIVTYNTRFVLLDSY